MGLLQGSISTFQVLVTVWSLCSVVDKVRLVLVLLVGVGLLVPRKLTWAAAAGVLLVTAGISIFRFFNGVRDHQPVHLFMVSSIGASIIFYFFRYPYLDRRDSWWGISKRYSTSREIVWRISQNSKDSPWYKTRIENISQSGILISGNISSQQPIRLELRFDSTEGYPSFALEAEIMHRDAGHVSLKFKFASLHQRIALFYWIRREVI